MFIAAATNEHFSNGKSGPPNTLSHRETRASRRQIDTRRAKVSCDELASQDGTTLPTRRGLSSGLFFCGALLPPKEQRASCSILIYCQFSHLCASLDDSFALSGRKRAHCKRAKLARPACQFANWRARLLLHLKDLESRSHSLATNKPHTSHTQATLKPH